MHPHPGPGDRPLREQAAAPGAETLSHGLRPNDRVVTLDPEWGRGHGTRGLTLGWRPSDSLTRETGQPVSATHPHPEARAHPAPAHVGPAREVWSRDQRSLHYAGTDGREEGDREPGLGVCTEHLSWRCWEKRQRAPSTLLWPFNMTTPNSFLPSSSPKCYFSRRRAYSFIQQTLWECPLGARRCPRC